MNKDKEEWKKPRQKALDIINKDVKEQMGEDEKVKIITGKRKGMSSMGMYQTEGSLSDKGMDSIEYFGEGYGLLFQDEDVKEKVQNAQKRLHLMYIGKHLEYGNVPVVEKEKFREDVDKIFLEEFGKEILK